MDFEYGLPITRRKVTEIPVNYLVIKDMEKMAEDNKIMTIKFLNKSGVLLHHNNCLKVVYYEDKHANGNEDINYDEKCKQR